MAIKISNSTIIDDSRNIIDVTNAQVTGISTLGTVQISSGIVTATTGIVTYYGDGSQLSGILGGLGISTSTTNQAQYIPYATSFGSTTGVGATTLLVYNPSTSSLGIGTASPDAALHVVDDIIISSGVSTADFKIKAYTDELGSLSFEDPVDGTQYFSITQDLSTLLFGVNDANLDTVFVVDPSGNVGVKTDSIGASRALDVYGNAVISGSITKGSGTFTIPHPIDSSKLLVHSFIEGPRADLIYRGKSKLSNGISTVMMDSHIGIITGTWEALCRNPQVFLQNNESFALVKASITDDGILTITSNQDTNATIDWMVVAERQDEVIKNANWTDDDGNPILEPTK